jgi:hypothetical protein
MQSEHTYVSFFRHQPAINQLAMDLIPVANFKDNAITNYTLSHKQNELCQDNFSYHSNLPGESTKPMNFHKDFDANQKTVHFNCLNSLVNFNVSSKCSNFFDTKVNDTVNVSNNFNLSQSYPFSPSGYHNLNLSNNNLLSMKLADSLGEPVVNLSSFQLTPAMISLLSKGLNFCPTPGEPDRYMLRRDLDRFHVNLRQRLHFSKNLSSTLPLDQTSADSSMVSTQTPPQGAFEHYKFKNPSSWNPKGPPPLEGMILVNEHLLNTINLHAPRHQNISQDEHQALAELQQATQIVIKPADKGSAVVIQNREDYTSEGLRQLSDTNFYEETETDLTMHHNSMVHELVQTLMDQGEISKKCHRYLCIDRPKTPELYLLPKIHKNKIPVPGRPIVSANNSPTERTSQLADFFLQPLVHKTRSYIKDTTDFINHIENLPSLNADSLLCTIDVSSLYTNIPNDEGISACRDILRKFRPSTDRPHNESIIKLLHQVLHLNNFDFNQKHFLQVGGTAMGTKVAPSFANIFMADFEEKWVYTHRPQPKIWLRYIDDIFMIWDHGVDSLQEFLAHLNSCHRTIKFTSEYSTQQVTFLDTVAKVDENMRLYTDLYCKPTDSHNYLLYDSAHPTHLKKSLPYSQLLRVRRICSHLEDFDRNATEIASHFLRRDYPQDLVEEALIKVRRIDRLTLLQPSTNPPKNDQDNLFLVNMFNPSGTPLRDIVSDTWPLIGRSHNTEYLYTKQVTFGNRRSQNLRDILIHAKLPDLKETPSRPLSQSKNKACKARTVCRYCPKLDKSGTITSNTTGRNYTAMKNITCNSNNLIYCISCKTCKKQYVGQTLSSIKERFKCHFTSITAPDLDNPIGRHFQPSNGHHRLMDITIHILEFIIAPDRTPAGQRLRDENERKWIHRLVTTAPFGLNLAD